MFFPTATSFRPATQTAEKEAKPSHSKPLERSEVERREAQKLRRAKEGPSPPLDPAEVERRGAQKRRRAEVARRRAELQALIVDEDALLGLPAVMALTGLSASSVYRLEKSGAIKAVRLGIRCTRFRSGDVAAWMRAQWE